MDLTREMRFSINQEMRRRGRVFQERIKTRRALRADARAPLVMLAHGDSWFDYPLDGNDISFDGPTDIIRQLDPTSVNDENVLSLRAEGPQYIIHNVSHWGYATTDELSRQGQQDMLDALENYWEPLGEKPDAILFSGGGNDIVGDQFAIYLDYAPPSQGIGLNEDRFRGALARVEASYKSLFAFRDKFAQGVPIFGHAYDYAIPNGVGAPCGIGPWLLPSLEYCGYSWDDQPDVCRAIVKSALQKFSNLLMNLAGEPRNNFHVIPTQGTLTDDSLWGNELHPTGDGFAKVADKFRAALNAHFATV